MDDTNVRARLSVEFQIRRQDIEDTITERSVRARGGPKSQLETSPDASVSSSELQPTLSSAPAATREPGPKKKKDKKKKIVEAPNWHELPLPELLNAISLPSTSEGLTAAEAAIRLEQKGPNIIDPPTESLILKILGYLFGGFNILLLGGAVLSIVAWRIGDPPDANNLGLAIILALVALISAGFNWYQEHKSSAVMNTIKKLLPTGTLRSIFRTVKNLGQNINVFYLKLCRGFGFARWNGANLPRAYTGRWRCRYSP